ncbi:hypothetical protein [Pseudomonas sp. R1-7]|uniref:hypothetical protein n=1 Tax=Pseudomonas sp. R1-7 TaxID=2817398 RepID=UPI003DA9F18D
MNPYLIQGPAQIGISGGRTSGHMAYEAHGGVLPPDVYLFFQNTGKEREETLIFIDQIAKRWNVNIVWMEWCRVYGQPDDAPWYKQKRDGFISHQLLVDPSESIRWKISAQERRKKICPLSHSFSLKTKSPGRCRGS